MKTSTKAFAALAFVALFSLVAFAAPNINIDGNTRWMRVGFWVMPQTTGGLTNTANRVTRMMSNSLVIDFPASTITCVDSASITVTGAQLGDPCVVGVPSAAAVSNAGFSCWVLAANAVLVRFCPAGTLADPLSGTFQVRTISNQ